MDANAINQAIAAIGQQLSTAVATLIPLGTLVTGSFIILSLIFVGISMMFGLTNMLPALMRVTGASTLTLYAIREWDDIVLMTLRATRQILALFIPGYTGPTALFQMAIDLFGRIELEHVAWTWSVAGVATLAAAVIVPVIVLVGLVLPGILAVLAEMQLLVGAAAAPLVLPALAFSFTVPLGWGPVNFVVKAAVRVVVMGLTAWMLAGAISSVMSVTGSTDGLTSQQIAVMMILALISMAFGLYANGIANDLVGGGAGSVGMGTASSTSSSLTNMASGAGAAMSFAAPAVGGAVVGAAKIGASAAGKAASAVGRSSGSGSAFN